MNRKKLNRNAFYLKILVLSCVIAYLIYDTLLIDHRIRFLIVGVAFIATTVVELRLHENAKTKRYACLLFQLLISFLIFNITSNTTFSIIMIVFIVTAVTTLENDKFRVSFAVVFTVTSIYHLTRNQNFELQDLLSFMMLLVFFLAYSSFYRRFEEQQYQLEEMNKSLLEFAKREKDWAIEQERNKIARAIHDNVAHQSTGLIVQIQKLSKAYELKLDFEVKCCIKEIELISRSMLNDMRQSVRMISPVETSESPFEQLFTDCQHLNDLIIKSNGLDELYSLKLSHQAELYAICKEALTNAKYHGHADTVEVNVVRVNNPHYIIINIKDNGLGLRDDWECGFGLSKIRESVKAVNGFFQIESNLGVEMIIKWPCEIEGNIL